MRIVHLITGLDRGGAEVMLHRLVSAMDPARFDNVVVCMIGEASGWRRLGSAPVAVHSLGMRRGSPGIGAARRLLRLLRALRPAVLQTWLYHADLLGLAIGRLAGTPAVLWNVRCSDPDLDYSRQTSAVVWLNARLSRWPSAVIVNSTAGRIAHERRGYRPRAWHLIPNGFDLERFRPCPRARAAVRAGLGIPEHETLIGLVARYDRLKGHREFLHAASAVHTRHPTCRFVLVGAGAEGGNPELAGALQAHRIAERVILLGERDDVPELMAAMDIAVSASHSEGFPNVVGEAMACAVPCVVTDCGDSARIVGDCGVVVAPRDAAALAGGILELVEAGGQRRVTLGRRARERVAREFALGAVVERYEALYERYGPGPEEMA